MNYFFTLQTSIDHTVTMLWARIVVEFLVGRMFFLYLKYPHWLWCPPSRLFSAYQGAFSLVVKWPLHGV